MVSRRIDSRSDKHLLPFGERLNMSTTEVLKDLFFIERGYLNANHLVYRADNPVLIDTGYISDFKDTALLIDSLGVNLENTRLIITTHCHCDHIGGNQAIQKMSGCDIVQHELGRHFIETRNTWALWWDYFNQQAAFFKPTGSMQDGQVLSIGPHQFEVIYTPGHASDGIALYNHKEKLLISSDALWEYDMAVHTVRIEGSAAIYNTSKSLQRLRELEVKTVCPGHGSIFWDFKGALERAQERIQRFMDDPELVGNDVLKKIIVYTLLMKHRASAYDLFDQLLETIWFKETVDYYFNGRYKEKYKEVMEALCHKGAVEIRDNYYYTTVRP